MSISVGIPILKLSNGAKATKRKGDAKKVCCEGFNERYSKDQDLDRSRSHLNTYVGYTSGKELYEDWMQMADNHTDAMGRHLRSDAVIGFTMCIKPDIENFSKLSEAERDKFLDDSDKISIDILQRFGLQVDGIARHKDEEIDHDHIFGHDPEYKCGRKIGLELYNCFNKEYPERMRQLGYDVKDMQVYDADKVAKMSEDEKAEYKADMIARKKAKKKSGRSSNQYKADKDAEAEARAKAIIEKAEAQARLVKLEAEDARETIRAEEKAKAMEEAEKYKKALLKADNELKERRKYMSMLSSNRNGQSISVEQMFQERMQKKQQQRQAVQQSNAERTKEIAEKADEMQKSQTMADVMKDAGIYFYSQH